MIYKKLLLITTASALILALIGKPTLNRVNRIIDSQNKAQLRFLPCLVDLNGDGIINFADPGELQLFSNPEECSALNGAIGLETLPPKTLTNREQTLELRKIEKNLRLNKVNSTGARNIGLFFNQSFVEKHFRDTNIAKDSLSSASSASSYSANHPGSSSSSSEQNHNSPDTLIPDTNLPPQAFAEVPQGIDGPIVRRPTTSIIPDQIKEEIKKRVVPKLKDKTFNDKNFHCQHFSDVAEKAYRPLTYTVLYCKIMCKTRIPRTHKPFRPNKYQIKVIGEITHALNDFHTVINGKKVMGFIEPQQIKDGSAPVAVNLDLNKDGHIDFNEHGPVNRSVAGMLDSDELSRAIKCSNPYATCEILSFDSLEKAREWAERNSK